MKKFACSWKCFATSLLIFTLLCITMVMVAGLVIIPVMYINEWEYDYDQVSKEVGDYPSNMLSQLVTLKCLIVSSNLVISVVSTKFSTL